MGKVDPTGLWAERYIFGVDRFGFGVNMRWLFRYKWYCQAFAADLIWHKRETWWRWSYGGMGQTRIAVELYAHAVAYYSIEALNRRGIRSDQITGYKQRAAVAYVNNYEPWWHVGLFYTVWWRVWG